MTSPETTTKTSERVTREEALEACREMEDKRIPITTRSLRAYLGNRGDMGKINGYRGEYLEMRSTQTGATADMSEDTMWVTLQSRHKARYNELIQLKSQFEEEQTAQIEDLRKKDSKIVELSEQLAAMTNDRNAQVSALDIRMKEVDSLKTQLLELSEIKGQKEQLEKQLDKETSEKQDALTKYHDTALELKAVQAKLEGTEKETLLLREIIDNLAKVGIMEADPHLEDTLAEPKSPNHNKAKATPKRLKMKGQSPAVEVKVLDQPLPFNDDSVSILDS